MYVSFRNKFYIIHLYKHCKINVCISSYMSLFISISLHLHAYKFIQVVTYTCT